MKRFDLIKRVNAIRLRPEQDRAPVLPSEEEEDLLPPDDESEWPRLALRGPARLPREDELRWEKISKIFNVACLAGPPVIAFLYLFLWASDVYEVDAVFAVKNPAMSVGGSTSSGGGLASLLGGSASTMNRAIDESYAIVTYFQSRDALRQLDKRMQLRAKFERPNGSFWQRLSRSASPEQFFDYFNNHMSVVYDDIEGQVDLTTYAFDAQTADRMAKELIGMGEQLVNEFNSRAVGDFIKVTNEEAEASAGKLHAAEQALTDFQMKNGLIDPSGVNLSLGTIITGLSTDAANTAQQIAALKQITRGGSPQLTALENHLAADNAEIKNQQKHLTGSAGGLAPIYGQFNFLQAQLQVAQTQYTTDLTTLTQAKFDAQRQNLYLVDIIPAEAPSDATLPKRFEDVGLVALISFMTWFVLRMIIAAIRDHMV